MWQRNSKSITIDNVEYSSHTEACKDLNVSNKTLNKILKGISIKKHAFKVTINEVEYQSIAEAMRVTGMSRLMITKNYLQG